VISGFGFAILGFQVLHLEEGQAVSADADDVRPGSSGIPAAQPRGESAEAELEYVRRVCASTREWYTVAETKAQLLLAVNGVFVTILFGVLFGQNRDVRSGLAALALKPGSFSACPH
jgi:hypothetical protein